MENSIRTSKVVETFYIIYEVPTPYSIELHNNIVADIEGIDESYSLIYKKVEKEPKIENPLSVETTENSNFLPKVENPLAANPLADNQRLLIIDHTKERKTNNRNHVHDNELDFFENLFKEFGINFTKTNKDSVLKLRKHLSLQDTESYLRETYTALKENKEVKNIAALFSTKIAKEERQINSKINNKNKNNNIEKSPKKKNDDIEKNDYIEIFEKLDTYDKLKIEEEAIELLIKEQQIEATFIFKTKEVQPTIYKGMIKSYIERAMKAQNYV